MWKLVGLGHLSSNEQFLLLLVAVCVSLGIGWVMDMIMERIGFGMIGNAGISIFAIFAGLYAYNTYYGRMSSPDIMVVIAFVVTSVMMHLVVLSILRRVLKIN
jgi:hypothetical protein